MGKTETFSDDLKYILDQKNLTLPGFANDELNSHNVEHEDDRTRKYFNQLSSRQRKQIRKLYQADLEMFGYDPDIFYD